MDEDDLMKTFLLASGHGRAAMGVLRVLIRALQQDLLLSPEGVAAIFELAARQAEESDDAPAAEIVRIAARDVLSEAPIKGV